MDQFISQREKIARAEETRYVYRVAPILATKRRTTSVRDFQLFGAGQDGRFKTCFRRKVDKQKTHTMCVFERSRTEVVRLFGA